MPYGSISSKSKYIISSVLLIVKSPQSNGYTDSRRLLKGNEDLTV